jgi:hypothetical protein
VKVKSKLDKDSDVWATKDHYVAIQPKYNCHANHLSTAHGPTKVSMVRTYFKDVRKVDVHYPVALCGQI